MAALLMLLVCIVLGALVARFARPPQGLATGINWWVLNVALPALVLALIPGLHLDAQLWFLVVAMWVVFIGAWPLFALIGRWRGWSSARVGTLTLMCGFGNTSFIGYPLIQALHGDKGLSLAVVASQIGCFPLLASVGITVASIHGRHAPGVRGIVRNVLLFPATLALLAGIAVNLLGGWPPLVRQILLPIGHTLTPLALFSVGLQLQLRLSRHAWGATTLGLGWKLLLAPLACWGLGWLAGVHGLILTVGVLQAGMAPMVSAAIIADDYALEPDLANTLLGLGILLSLLIAPAINVFLPG